MKKAIGSILLALLLLLSANPAAQAAAGDWTQFQQDDQRSGQISAATGVSVPGVAWSKFVYSQNGDGIQNTAVVSGDTVYVFAGDKLLALARSTGATLWEQDLEGHGALQMPTPACGDGKIFIATSDGYVMAFDAQNGTALWSQKVSQRGFQCPLTYSDGRLYIGDGGTGGETNNYYCLDESGSLCWTYNSATGGYLWCGCSVIGDYLAFGNLEGVVTSVYKDTGKLADRVVLSDIGRIDFARAMPGRIRASVSYHNGYIYASSENAWDEGYLWKIGFDQSSGMFLNRGFSAAIGFSTSTPVVYQDRIYVGQGEHGYPGSMLCLNDTDGSVVWSYPVEMGVKCSPTLMVTGDGLYLYFTTAMDDGYLYCLDGNGKLVWKYNPPDNGYVLQGPAASSDGSLYFGTNGGYLYCLKNLVQADLDGDGRVNAADMNLVCQHLGETGSSGWIPEDINGDGLVNVLDMVLLGQRWTD